MPETIDITARSAIASTQATLSSHEKFCTERAADAIRFENDMRQYLTGLNDKLDHYISNNNRFIRAIGLTLIGLLGSTLLALIGYIWAHK